MKEPDPDVERSFTSSGHILRFEISPFLFAYSTSQTILLPHNRLSEDVMFDFPETDELSYS